eukprot:scaffold144651_cov47-Attheya_sp.AAC.4
MVASSFRLFKWTLYVLLSVSLTKLLFQCWPMVFMELLTILFLLIFHSLVASILTVCRHFYYCRQGTLVDATIVDGTTFEQKDEDRTIGGALREIVFCYRFEKVRSLVEYDAEVVDVSSSPGNEKGKTVTTSYRTIRVQKWLAIPGKLRRANPLPVMVLPGRPRSAIVQEQQCPRMLCAIFVFFANAFMTSTGVLLPLLLVGGLGDGCDDYDCIDGCHSSWDVQLAYAIAAVVASLLLRICNVTEPSVVTVAGGQEMKDMDSTGVPMVSDCDTVTTDDTETTDTSIC